MSNDFLVPITRSYGTINLAHYTIDHLPDDFYPSTAKKLAFMVGNETDSRNYHGAINFLNDRLALHLDPIDEKIIYLMLLELNKARRFNSEIAVPQQYRENSAVHTCHTSILFHELLRLAGLNESSSSFVNALRIEGTLMILVHDMGELWGELSSLSQRIINTNRQELPLLERRIFSICLFEACKACIEPHKDYAFHEKLMEMRQRAGLIENGGASDLERLRNTVEFYEQEQENYKMPAQMQRRIERFLDYWTAIEFAEEMSTHNPDIGFIALFAKCAEHLQGTRHFSRFRKIESDLEIKPALRLFSPSSTPSLNTSDKNLYLPAIATEICSSSRIIGNAKYDENELFALATCSKTEEQQKLALQAIKSAYLTTIERLQFFRPVADLTVSSQSAELNELLGKLSIKTPDQPEFWPIRNQVEECMRRELRLDTIRYDVQARTNTNLKVLRPLESRARLMALYLQAVISEYTPENKKPLLLLGTNVPKQLDDFNILAPLFEHPTKILTHTDLNLLTVAHKQQMKSGKKEVQKFVSQWLKNG